MSRNVQIVVLCEDMQHRTFLRRSASLRAATTPYSLNLKA